ncbi:hypothetical protein EVAR_40687_1 [Eumeta japonica]|uniref:Tesmin/TSO1-like CXC domain-containing protein n=1 Tax=Eumeta variegata TaxID=151549 RepID=A0A4C1X8T3_EUMVA|nr:hypothetical protein EVAR_40687_1 [Eumeta japonica]
MCGCRKAGMKCSAVCFHCSGETCSNVMELSELINENDFDDEPPTLTPLPSPVLPLAFCTPYAGRCAKGPFSANRLYLRSNVSRRARHREHLVYASRTASVP